MHTRKEPTEQVQLWITVAQQPGVGAWLNVWLVSRSRRAKAPATATARKLPQGACTA